MSLSAVGAERLRSRSRLTPRAAALLIVVMALLLYLVMPLRAYVAQRDRLAQLEQEAQALEVQNAKLRAEVLRLDDPAYIERIARECLGMVQPGELGFVAVPGSGPPLPSNC